MLGIIVTFKVYAMIILLLVITFVGQSDPRSFSDLVDTKRVEGTQYSHLHSPAFKGESSPRGSGIELSLISTLSYNNSFPLIQNSSSLSNRQSHHIPILKDTYESVPLPGNGGTNKGKFLRKALGIPQPPSAKEHAVFFKSVGNGSGQNGASLKVETEGLESSKKWLKLGKYYRPEEIANYIYSTGDEKGIVQTILEMVEEGQIMESLDDLINFLESVEKDLNSMRKGKNNSKPRKKSV